MIRRQSLGITLLAAGFFAVGGSSTAAAQGATDIGGRFSITGNFSVATTKPDDFDESTALTLGVLGAYTTESGRFEVGGGLAILGLFTDPFDAAIYNLTAQGRINSNPLGPEENVLLYAGGVIGLGVIDTDIADDEEVGVFGPKVGAEFYVTPSMAIQIEDVFLGDTEDNITNNFTVGFKLLFN
jgi:hypothetical protein